MNIISPETMYYNIMTQKIDINTIKLYITIYKTNKLNVKDKYFIKINLLTNIYGTSYCKK